MTGGSETQITDPIYGPTYVWVPGSYTTSADQKQWVTTGGQIGAPLASPTGPSFGEWTHQLHCTQGSKGNCPGTAFAFDFKAGTASNKGTIINTVVCGDQGYCVPARCAPFKQIFWDGIGVIKNIKGTFPLPTGVTCTNMGEGTFHYFKAHVGDFGEPGSTQVRKNQPPTCSTPCPWTSGGVDISNIVPLSPVSPAPNNTIGGQICPCGCGDWYEIEIHCTTDPTSSIIYRFAHLIDTGDLQIHPPVGDSCH